MKSVSFSSIAGRLTFKPLLRAALAAALLMMAVSSQAAVNVFVKLMTDQGPVPGDSLMKGYLGVDGWFEISGMDLGIENSVTLGSASGGGGAGKASFQKLTLSKIVDSVSPKVFKAVGMGTPFKSVTIVFLKQTGAAQPQAYLTYDMNLVFATSQKWSGKDDGAVGETLTFEFAALKMTYFKQKPDGSLEKTGIIQSWNVLKNNDNFEDVQP